MAKITAYRKDTGAKVRIPEHWIGDPKLGRPFTTTPPTEKSAEVPPDGGAAPTSEVAKPATRKEK